MLGRCKSTWKHSQKPYIASVHFILVHGIHFATATATSAQGLSLLESDPVGAMLTNATNQCPTLG